MAVKEQKTITPEEALALLEDALSYYTPESAETASEAEAEPEYLPFAA